MPLIIESIIASLKKMNINCSIIRSEKISSTQIIHESNCKFDFNKRDSLEIKHRFKIPNQVSLQKTLIWNEGGSNDELYNNVNIDVSQASIININSLGGNVEYTHNGFVSATNYGKFDLKLKEQLSIPYQKEKHALTFEIKTKS